jgi:CheY-like chemotaxis protein/nitrogen-specific signal transduction histidine kinase
MYFTIENPDVKMLNKIELAKIQAEKANAAKTDFLSSMSHEIRTPLNAIVGFSEAIEDSDTIDEAKENAQDIIKASNNLLEIVNGILDISKIEANKMEIFNTEYNLKEEIKNLIKLIKPRIGEKPITLNTYVAPDIPGVLYGDKGKIKEIISNILTNAVKYTDKGSIDLKINCINKNDDCSIIISVEDTGRGIKPENIDKLFNKFERIEEDRNTTIEGAGLGLAITKSLVEMMGGKIIVQSIFGKGSVFTVYLKQRIISAQAKEFETIVENTKLQLNDKKVLVVDDNDLNNKVAEKLLKKYGITPDICTTGYDCIDLIKQGKKYDLILMDDMMPKLTGTETLHILQEMPSFKDKIVVLTANAIEGMKERYIDAGFDDYLAKPIDKQELERVLRKYLNKEKEKIDFEPIPESFYTISDQIVEQLNNKQEKKDTN